MKLSWKSKTLFILLLLLPVSAGLKSQDIPEPMVPYRLVNDFAGIFSEAETKALEQKLRAYHDTTSTQIYVVTVPDLGGYPASDYAFRLGEKWGIGQKSKNNGAVILIKPKVGNSRGQAFIATGYGLEARINDAYAGRIVRNEMIPRFAEGDYFGGVNAAVDTMIARLSGEFTAEEEEEEGIPLFAIIIFNHCPHSVFYSFHGGRRPAYRQRWSPPKRCPTPVFSTYNGRKPRRRWLWRIRRRRLWRIRRWRWRQFRRRRRRR